MESILEKLADWIKGILIGGIMDNLSGLFDAVNDQVGSIADQMGTTPEIFEPRVYAMIHAVSEQVIVPIAGIVLTFIACHELIQLLIEHNNLANFETWIFFKWVFKTFVAVTLISNTFDIVMAVFDVAQHVIDSSSSIISGNTRVNDIGLGRLNGVLMEMEVGELLSLYLQSFVIGLTMWALSIIIFVVVYGRMIEIYMAVSLAPIPFATFGSQEQGQIGQNYLRSLLALGFQGFLILICVGIYAVLIQNVAISDDVIASVWSVVGYTVLLAFTLFKSSSLARSVFNAH